MTAQYSAGKSNAVTERSASVITQNFSVCMTWYHMLSVSGVSLLDGSNSSRALQLVAAE